MEVRSIPVISQVAPLQLMTGINPTEFRLSWTQPNAGQWLSVGAMCMGLRIQGVFRDWT